MFRLRQLASAQLLQNAQQEVQEQLHAASILPSVVQLWDFQLQQTCCMATAKPAPKVPSLHERRVANYEYCKAREIWRRKVGKLRMQWLKEYKDRFAAKQQEAESVKQQVKQLRELQNAAKQTDETRDTLDRQLRDAERAYEMAMIRCAAAVRQEFRQRTLEQYQEGRRGELLEASRHWIPAEQLEARIAAALDNPTHF
eukprot:GHUV01007292.1.p1 GENE.GHUV01007292.1~~GHUV01007292.1.p1  ORF type:complete len:199 (+),score=47.27 GHUV01007292.1:286-882(+)